MAPMSLSAEDVQDILRLLDTLPFDELTLETSRFTLRLQRAADGGWAQETNVAARPAPTGTAPPTGPAPPGPAPPGPAPPGPTPPTASPPPTEPAPPAVAAAATGPAGQPASEAASRSAGALARGTGTEAETGRDVREVRAPLLGTFYRAPQPGAPPYVEIGSQVAADTVVAIIETMKLMNPVYAGTAGTVSEICLDDGQFAEQDAVLMRVSARAR
ncbi:MAG: acetyl-CoA carboxylase biotin carboxyl carrier protein [Streptosporangiaceae bacterium]